MEIRLRNYDPIKESADILSKEIKEYDFKLSGTLCTAKDIFLSQNRFEDGRPNNWMAFLTHLSRGRKQNRLWYLRADFLVQFIAYWLASSMTLIMCAITEMIHGMIAIYLYKLINIFKNAPISLQILIFEPSLSITVIKLPKKCQKKCQKSVQNFL